MKTTSSLFIVAALLAAALPASACINQSGTNKQGHFIMPASYAGERLKPYLVTPPDNDAIPKRPAALPLGKLGKPRSLFDVGIALRFQLVERIKFVAAPDPMVAGMLLDWANLEFLAGSVESADVLNDAALRYGSNEAPTITLRKAQVARILKAAETQSRPNTKDGECELCMYPNPPR